MDSKNRRSGRIKRYSVEEAQVIKKGRYSLDVLSLSPTTLLKKLDAVKTEDLEQCAPACVDLKDLGTVINTEQYEKLREDVRQQVPDPESFDVDGKTELNTTGAIVAGAKLFVDETRATRSMCKKLKEEAGVDEDDVLYQPLSYQGALGRTCLEARENRQASVAESYVDFKKQLTFKSNILEHVVNKEVKKAKTDQRGVRAKKKFEVPPQTPANKFEINPLDGERIINNYALEVASTVRENRKPRKIAPIPFNINCLDDDDTFVA